MKKLAYFILPVLVACVSYQNDEQETAVTDNNIEATEENNENSFDSTLAQKLGADQYGMKPYIMAFLKTGPNAPKDSLHAIELQNAHMSNIGRLAEAGKLVLAGPFYGDQKGDFRGIYIFNTDNIDSAKAYTESDPAIKYGSLKMELINWYGSAAVMGINEVHSKIAKVDV